MTNQQWQPIETAPKDGTWIDLWAVPLNGVPGGAIPGHALVGWAFSPSAVPLLSWCAWRGIERTRNALDAETGASQVTNAEILARFRECKRLAEEGEPLSPDERAEFRSSIARQRAEDDAARAATSPQAPLLLA